MKAAKAAGVNARVDGRLNVIPIEDPKSTLSNEWDEVLDQASPKIHPRLS
jgi:hypothetical protein